MSSNKLNIHKRKSLDGINRLLNDIYGSELLLSDILSNAGFKKEYIAEIKTKYLSIFLNELILNLDSWLQSTLTERRYFILVNRYEIKGEERLTLKEVGKKLNVSRERIRQIQKGIIKRLKPQKRKAELESLVVNVAKAIAGKSI